MQNNVEFNRVLDHRLILSVIASGILSFIGIVVETAMNTTFPTLMKEFGVSTSMVQWLTTGYLLILSAIIPSSAFLKRRFKTKTLFIAAISLFIVGTVMCGIAPVFSILLAGRLIQGVGTGIALPMMFNIIQEQAPFENMGLLMGIGTMLTAMAPAVGPFFGGLIIRFFSWRLIFAVLMPLLIVALIIGVTNIRQSSEVKKGSGYDFFGNAVLAICFLSLILSGNFAGTKGWLSIQTIGFFAAAIALAVFYLFYAGRRGEKAVINMEIFKERRFTCSLIALFTIQFMTLAIGFVIPNFAQITWNQSALVAGCILVPGCALLTVLSPVGGRVMDKKGARIPLLTGALATVIASALFFLVPLSKASVISLTLVYMIFTFGQSFTAGNTMANGLGFLTGELKADGNAAFNTLQQLGGAFGTVIAAAIVAQAQNARNITLSHSTELGSHAAFGMIFAGSMILLICQILATRKN